jgi:hypothetical protein
MEQTWKLLEQQLLLEQAATFLNQFKLKPGMVQLLMT